MHQVVSDLNKAKSGPFFDVVVANRDCSTGDGLQKDIFGWLLRILYHRIPGRTIVLPANHAIAGLALTVITVVIVPYRVLGK
jgi:hypothetical protein